MGSLWKRGQTVAQSAACDGKSPQMDLNRKMRYDCFPFQETCTDFSHFEPQLRRAGGTRTLVEAQGRLRRGWEL